VGRFVPRQCRIATAFCREPFCCAELFAVLIVSRLKAVTFQQAREPLMKDFPDAAFAPDVIELMCDALEASVATLPDPVNSARVTELAESILRTAKSGERDVAVLQRMALLEIQLAPRG
jgi:hypothetical protein